MVFKQEVVAGVPLATEGQMGARVGEELGSLVLLVAMKSRDLSGTPEAQEVPPGVWMGDAADGMWPRCVAAGAVASPILPGGVQGSAGMGAPAPTCGRCLQKGPWREQVHPGHSWISLCPGALGRGASAVLTRLLRATGSRELGPLPGHLPFPTVPDNTWPALPLSAFSVLTASEGNQAVGWAKFPFGSENSSKAVCLAKPSQSHGLHFSPFIKQESK